MKILNNGLNKFDKFLNYISVATLFFMMILIFADVALRFTIGSPFVGVVELTGEYLLVIIVFFSVSYAYKEGDHVRVELITQYLSEKVNNILRIINNLIILIVGGALVITNLQKSLEYFERGIETTSLLSYPLAPAYLIISIGLFSFLVRIILEIIYTIKGFKTEN